VLFNLNNTTRRPLKFQTGKKGISKRNPCYEISTGLNQEDYTKKNAVYFLCNSSNVLLVSLHSNCLIQSDSPTNKSSATAKLPHRKYLFTFANGDSYSLPQQNLPYHNSGFSYHESSQRRVIFSIANLFRSKHGTGCFNIHQPMLETGNLQTCLHNEI
jgi:hypothetical protein